MNLEILELSDSYLHWLLNGYHGNSFIEDGKAFDAHLCEGPFHMKPDTLRLVKVKVQEWLDSQLSPDQKVEEVRFKLLDHGVKVRVRRRKLAHREKTYLHIVTNDINEWRFVIKPLILDYFPDAYLTAGGFFSKTNINVALEK
jgi:hypothetical protein